MNAENLVLKPNKVKVLKIKLVHFLLGVVKFNKRNFGHL